MAQEEVGMNVWVGNYGDYPIPEKVLEGVVMTKSGYPDRRYILPYQKFMAWVKSVDHE
jgi:hypothetical protein